MRYFSFLFIIMIIVISCKEGPLAPEKYNVPGDHTENQEYALHKPNMEHPYAYDRTTGEINCASSRCHNSDLRGGRARIDGKYYVAPSCYQCHGKLWEEIDKSD